MPYTAHSTFARRNSSASRRPLPSWGHFSRRKAGRLCPVERNPQIATQNSWTRNDLRPASNLRKSIKDWNERMHKRTLNAQLQCTFQSFSATFLSLLSVVNLLESDVKLLENRSLWLHFLDPHAGLLHYWRPFPPRPLRTPRELVWPLHVLLLWF